MSVRSTEIKRASRVLIPIFSAALIAAACRPTPEASPTPEPTLAPTTPTATLVEAQPTPTITAILPTATLLPTAEPTRVIPPRSAESVNGLTRETQVFNARYRIFRETQSRDSLYQAARDMTALRAAFISGADQSVGLSGGIVTLNGRKYDLNSDNDLAFAAAVIEAKLPRIAANPRTPAEASAIDKEIAGRVNKLEKLYDSMHLVDTDTAPFLSPDHLYPLSSVIDTLHRHGKPTPKNWRRVSDSNLRYDASSDTVSFHPLNPIAALGAYYGEINPALPEPAGRAALADRENKFSRKGIGLPPNSFIFLSDFHNFFVWYMKDGTGFRQRMRFTQGTEFTDERGRRKVVNPDPQAEEALKDVYNGFKEYFGFEVSEDGLEHTTPATQIQIGSRVELAGSLEGYQGFGPTPVNYTVTQVQRRSNIREMLVGIDYSVKVTTKDGKQVSQIGLDEDQLKPAGVDQPLPSDKI